MQSKSRFIGALLGAAIVVWGLCFALGATVLKESHSKVVVLQAAMEEFEIPREQFAGPADAPVTIIEVSDFECGYCRKVQGVLARIDQEYEGRLRHAFIAYPRGQKPHKEVYGTAYLAALKQGRGAAFRNAMFSARLRSETEDDSLRRAEAVDAVLAAGREVGLDIDKFRADMDAPGTREEWERQVAAAKTNGTEATPTIFVNGCRVQGALEIGGYRKILDRAIESEMAT